MFTSRFTFVVGAFRGGIVAGGTYTAAVEAATWAAWIACAKFTCKAKLTL